METDSTLGFSASAGADLSTKQFHAVKLSTSAAKTVVLATATTDDVFILQNDPTSGQAAEVHLIGPSKAKIGGTVTPGDRLGPDTDAMLITVTADGKKFCAYALQAGVDGDVIDVLLVPASQIAG